MIGGEHNILFIYHWKPFGEGTNMFIRFSFSCFMKHYIKL